MRFSEKRGIAHTENRKLAKEHFDTELSVLKQIDKIFFEILLKIGEARPFKGKHVKVTIEEIPV